MKKCVTLHEEANSGPRASQVKVPTSCNHWVAYVNKVLEIEAYNKAVALVRLLGIWRRCEGKTPPSCFCRARWGMVAVVQKRGREGGMGRNKNAHARTHTHTHTHT